MANDIEDVGFSAHKVNNEMSFQIALINIKNELETIGFKSFEASKFLTAVSELARNILKYASQGVLEVYPLYGLNKKGLKVVAIDRGQGITNIDLAMSESFSSSGTLGQGLPGAKRLVDQFHIESSSLGTKVTVTSWI